jgi:hypothetical protein
VRNEKLCICISGTAKINELSGGVIGLKECIVSELSRIGVDVIFINVSKAN